MRRILVAVSALALVAACNQKPAAPAVDASSSETPAVNNTGVQPGTGATVVLADFVPRAAASDMYEIEAGKLAQTRGVSADLKAFGQMLQTDHTKSAADLKAAIAAAGQTVVPPTTLPADKQAMLDTLKTTAPAEFDRVFWEQQEAAHEEALNLMKVYADGGDVEQVKAFASQTAPVVQIHLDKVQASRAAMK